MKDEPTDPRCAICDETFAPGDYVVFHHRLGVTFHASHDLHSEVCGEDISTHTLGYAVWPAFRRPPPADPDLFPDPRTTMEVPF